MSPVTLISLIKNELENLKKQGIEKVSIDELMDYLSKIELANQNLSDLSLVELERYKAQLNMWVEQQKSQTKLWAEGFKSVILSGQNALRSALLINGGTAIALLAYIGRLKIAGLDQASTLAFPLAIFVVGVLVTAINSGITYLAQWFYFGGGKWKQKVGFVLNMTNIIL